MANPLPVEIKYLGCVIDKLSEIDVEELADDDTEVLDLVDEAIAPIIAGMSDLKAKEVLGKHFQRLRGWLQQPPDARAGFSYF